MAYQIVQKFYELRKADLSTSFTPEQLLDVDSWVVLEYFDDDEPHNSRIVMRGTESQCKAWLDERPGSAISIAE